MRPVCRLFCDLMFRIRGDSNEIWDARCIWSTAVDTIRCCGLLHICVDEVLWAAVYT